MARDFPRQDILESQKNKEWCQKVVDYAVDVHDNRLRRVGRKHSRLWAAYNGKVNRSSIQYLTNTYGKVNNIKFVDYRMATPKINLIHGEFLSLPLQATVSTVNSDAKTQKLNKYYVMLGLSLAKEEVNILREKIGVDPFDGMEAPPIEDKDAWASLNFKDRNEKAMQILVDDQVKMQNLRDTFGNNFLDVEVVAECFGKIEHDHNGQIYFRDIDPRNAIFTESDRDMFLDRSPIKGERKIMFIHEILAKWGHLMNKDQRDELHHMQNNPANFHENDYKGHEYYHMVDNQLGVEVYMVEWASTTPYRRKVVPNKKDPKAEPVKKELTNEFYEKNKSKIDREVKKGKYEIETKWRTEWWEGTKIGHNIYINCQKKHYQYVENDNPHRSYSDYVGFLLPSRDGVRISIMELLENISHVYNITMFQINRELAKAKGKVVGYDMAYLPKGKELNDVLYNLANDSLYIYNSSEDGRVSEGEAGGMPGLKEIDLGVSQAIQHLINLKMDLQATADRISGINDTRQGMTAASATATASQSDLAASRTITFPVFYFFGQYQNRVMKQLIEKSKIIIGSGHNEERMRRILGDDVFNYIKITKDIRNFDYGVSMTDGRKEQDIRQRMLALSQAAVNNGELRMQDVIRVEMAETLAEAEQILENSWDAIMTRQQQTKEQEIQSNQELSQQQMQFEQTRHEDIQQHDKDVIILKGEVDKEIKAGEAADKRLLEQEKAIATREPAQ